MSKPVKIHNARFGRFPVSCECGQVVTLALTKGNNKRTTVCVQCKGLLRIEAVYDGYGVATLKKMTLEKVEKEYAN